MTLTWLVQLKTRNAGFVDVTWSAMMAFAAALYGVTGSGAGLPRLLVVMLGGIWGLRLSLHLLSRVLNEAEDGRYRALREHWNDHQGRMFGMFMLQASFVVIFSLPFLAVAANPEGALSWWTLLGSRRSPARRVPPPSRERLASLSRRTLALLAASQLFF
jgi:steroid 5-alpha reductase family enzyme